MSGRPLRDITVEELWKIAMNYKTTQKLVDAYADAHNKFWLIEDEIYDYEENSAEYKQTEMKIDSWEKIYDYLEGKVVACAKEEAKLKVLLIDCKLIMNSLDVIINLEFSVNKAIFVGNSPVYL